MPRKVKKVATVKSRRPPLRPGLRWQVFARDNFHCQVCGDPASEKVKLEVDHIIPVCKGGLTVLENLRVLCRTCNRGKGGTVLTKPSKKASAKPKKKVSAKPAKKASTKRKNKK